MALGFSTCAYHLTWSDYTDQAVMTMAAKVA